MTVLFTEHFIAHRGLPGSVSAAFWVTDMVALLAALRPKGAEQRWGTHGLWGERKEPFPEILCSRSPYMEAHSTSGATIHQSCFSQAGGRGWFPRVD